MKQKGKDWRNAKGQTIPRYAINPVLIIEEKHAHTIAALALRAEKALGDLVGACRTAHKEIYEAKLKDAKIKDNGTPPDGMTINAFDGSVAIKLTKPENMYFDNTYMRIVQDKFDEYFNTAFDGSDEKSIFLRQLVSDLLRTSGGNLDQNKVLQLRKYRASLQEVIAKKPADPAKLFIEAVDLMDKAIKTKPGNMGIYIDLLNEQNGKMERVKTKYTEF